MSDLPKQSKVIPHLEHKTEQGIVREAIQYRVDPHKVISESSEDEK